MPALLTIVNSQNSDPGNGGTWRGGEAVNNLDGHVFGWFEMPKTYLGTRTVAQINSADLSNIDPYIVVEIVDSGTINQGFTTNGIEPMEVGAGNAVVLQFNDTQKFWTNCGPRPSAEYNLKHRYHWRVSDKTTEEMQAYMDTHHKEIEFTLAAGPDPDGRRRYEVLNLYTTESGDNTWSREGVDAILEEWNTRYPDSDLIEYAPYTDDTVFLDGTFTAGQAAEFQAVITEFGLGDLHARRRWYINAQGMQALANNNGFMNTTAQELGPVFRDGLLD